MYREFSSDYGGNVEYTNRNGYIHDRDTYAPSCILSSAHKPVTSSTTRGYARAYRDVPTPSGTKDGMTDQQRGYSEQDKMMFMDGGIRNRRVLREPISGDKDSITVASPMASGLFSVSVCCVIVFIWSVIMIVAMAGIPFVEAGYFHWGPHPALYVFHHKIDTAWSFCALTMAVFINQLIVAYSYNVIHTWIVNVIQDHKQKFVATTSTRVYLIRVIYSTFIILSLALRFHVLLIQVTFIVVIIAAEIIVAIWVTHAYGQDKKFAQGMAAELSNSAPLGRIQG